MTTAYSTLKRAAAIANRDGKRLDEQRYGLIVQTCDEILAGQHHDMFPLHVDDWKRYPIQFSAHLAIVRRAACKSAKAKDGSND